MLSLGNYNKDNVYDFYSHYSIIFLNFLHVVFILWKKHYYSLLYKNIKSGKNKN